MLPVCMHFFFGAWVIVSLKQVRNPCYIVAINRSQFKYTILSKSENDIVAAEVLAGVAAAAAPAVTAAAAAAAVITSAGSLRNDDGNGNGNATNNWFEWSNEEK